MAIRPSDAHRSCRETLGGLEGCVITNSICMAGFADAFRIQDRYPPCAFFSHLHQSGPSPFNTCLRCKSRRVVDTSVRQLLYLHSSRVRAHPVGNAQHHNGACARSRGLQRRLTRSRGSRDRLLVVISLRHGSLRGVYHPNDISIPALFTVRPCTAIFRLVTSMAKALQPKRATVSTLATLFPKKSVANTPGRQTVRVVSRLRFDQHRLCAKAVNCLSLSNGYSLGVIVQATIRRSSRCAVNINNNVATRSSRTFRCRRV